ncbi:hypothetical protein MAAFP003_4554 [Mycobacterium ahvazicum]|uniref:Uncharacterized protein n=1 Tax=Mycobacterium ahvazicum TaxID=1964395 RepID=A0A2K4YGG8_9MYCO|nr:hypothetical protein MAAFP003_4554 [Mycobacterium ahvazicum]
MADIGDVSRRPASVERASVTGWCAGVVFPANSAQVGVGSFPLPHNSIGRLLADLVVGAREAATATVSSTPPSPRGF